MKKKMLKGLAVRLSKVFIASVALAGVAGVASAATIIQDSGLSDAAIGAFDPIGQSFMAEDPLLGSIAFAFSDMNPKSTNSPITMTLYAGAGFDGSVAHSVVQTLPSLLPGTYDSPEFIDFDFSGLSLTMGEIYTAAVTTNSYKVGVVFNGINDAYAGGQLFHSGNSLSGYDLNFRVTPSSVPIPGAVWLLGSGVAGIAGIRLRREKK